MSNFLENIAARQYWPEIRGKVSRRFDSILSIPSEIALRVMNMSPPGPSETVHDDLKTHLDLKGLTKADAEIVRELHRTGAAVTSLEKLALPGTQAMLRDADDLTGVLAARGSRPDMLRTHTIPATPDEVLARDRILRWGLNDRLLDLVEAYLGGPSAYDGLLFYMSRADGREEGVREWHRDREDARMLKVAIYLTDVDENGGPFELLTPEFQALVDRRENRKYPVMDSTRLNEAIPADVREKGIRTITGLRGTVLIVDTARFHHRGKPPVVAHRNAIFHSYFARVPRHPYCCERSMMTRAQIAAFANTLPERARACTLWRESLPVLKRLIPPNRIKI